MSTAESIKVLNGQMEQELINKEERDFVNLGINTRLGALIINNVMYFLSDSRPARCHRYYGSDGQKGGGLFCKGQARITINDLNEVGIYFGNNWGVSSYLRVATGKAERAKAIKNKLADALKKMWNARIHRNDDGTEYMLIEKMRSGELSTSDYNHKEYVIPLTEEEQVKIKESGSWNTFVPKIMITKQQYRIMYEFLKGRNVSDYDQRVFNSIIGKKIDDQFVISAIEVIRGEMQKVQDEYQNNLKISNEEFNAQIDELRRKKDEEAKRLLQEMQEKTDALTQQLKEISNSAINSAINSAFTETNAAD